MPLARFSVVVLASLVVAAAALAEDAKPVVAPELKALIRQLDADEFADRNAASEKLSKLGKDAIPALEEGVHSDSREAATRSFELLQRFFEKGDEAAKIAARSSLEKLAQGADGVATQAKKLLEPKPATPDPNQPVTGGIRIIGGVGGIRIRGGGFAPAVPIGPAIAVRDVKSVSTSIGPDGVKTINVDDNGKKIKIVEDPKKGIEGELTETKDGKETTQKFAAKDADELKTKHPDAHKLYEQYAKGAGELRVELGAIPPAAIEARAAARASVRAMTKERMEELLKRLEEQIEKVKQTKDVPEAEKAILARKLETYERLRESYKEQIKKLEAVEEKVEKKEEK